MLIVACQKCGKEIEAITKRRRVCRECFRDSEREYSRRQRASWTPSRRRAYELVHAALNRGDLARTSCEVCGSDDVNAHHDDYERPLDVRWLCLNHHQQHHAKFGPGKNAFVQEASE